MMGLGGPVGLGRLGLFSPAEPGKGRVGVPMGLPFAADGVTALGPVGVPALGPPVGVPALGPVGVIISELGREFGLELGLEFGAEFGADPGGVPVLARERPETKREKDCHFDETIMK